MHNNGKAILIPPIVQQSITLGSTNLESILGFKVHPPF
jgi:hypothetical protein